MLKPNLFIVGAPRCGTTALAQWLSGHSQVFVSTPKEPHYFSDEHQWVFSLDAYEKLFAGTGDRHRWICEASVW